MAEAWRLVQFMIHKYYLELKLDIFLGITGEHWMASFYSPAHCRRCEGRGSSAPLAISRAAKETYLLLNR
ncbi:MAG: hypothetical protein ACUVXF_02195 [Desulfobaccales bacterium]